MTRLAFHALNRFGLGARAGEAAKIQGDARGFVLNQLTAKSTLSYRGTYSHDDINAYASEAYRRSPWTGEMSKELPKEKANDAFKVFSRHQEEAIKIRFKNAIRTETPFHERLMYFWHNHFAANTSGHAPGQEFVNIRDNLFGKFEDLVLAASPMSSSMQVYLNSYSSFGMNSKFGKGRRGMNENLGRELLELHTLGVNGGYTQDDVIELSKALTGWSRNGWIPQLPVNNFLRAGEFYFYEEMHEPGSRVILGKTYAEGGLVQVEQIVSDLCKTKACATFICTKLVRHFFNDNPTQWVVDQLVAKWLETDGSLGDVYDTMIRAFFDNPALAGVEGSEKFRDQWEWSVAAGRYLLSLGASNIDEVAFASNGFGLTRSGVWDWTSPAGNDDIKETLSTREMFWRLNKWTYIAKNIQTDNSVWPTDFADVSRPSAEFLATLKTTAEKLKYYFITSEFIWR